MECLEFGVLRVWFGNLFVRLRENPLCDFVVECTQVKGVHKKFGGLDFVIISMAQLQTRRFLLLFVHPFRN